MAQMVTATAIPTAIPTAQLMMINNVSTSSATLSALNRKLFENISTLNSRHGLLSV